jgi:hypothetical protein
LDPDLRVQEALKLVFRKFRELGSVRQTLLWFLNNDLQLPARHWDGRRWVTVWKRPRYGAVHKILTHPTYAGAYCYGQTEQVVEFQEEQPRKRTRRRSQEEWLALIPGHHEGYLEWEGYERNRETIAQNMAANFSQSPGAAKDGPALLAGLLRCRRCGRKLIVGYTGRAANVTRYICCRGSLDVGEPRCINFGGQLVEDYVSSQALRVVEPARVEAAIAAAEQAVHQFDEVLATRNRELEAACYAADLAQRQYELVDPANRLVARELERRWNDALREVASLEDRIAQEVSMRSTVAAPAVEDFLDIAKELHAVWHDSKTSHRLKKRILRTLIHEIVVDTANGSIDLTIHWQGGVHTTGSVKRRRRGQNRLHTSPDVIDAVRALAKICPDHIIAAILNRNGLRTGKGNRWTQERVTSLRAKRKIKRHCAERQQSEGWMTLTQASEHLKISPSTLRQAAEQQVLPVDHPLPDGPWIFRRSDLDSEAARKLVDRTRQRTKKGGAARSPHQRNLEFPGT